MSSDDLTEILRLALFAVQLGAGFILLSLMKTIPMRNPVPWIFTITVHFFYAASMFFLLRGSDLVIENWWRPMWSVLNIFTAFGSTWLIYRLVKRGDRL